MEEQEREKKEGKKKGRDTDWCIAGGVAGGHS
jgi:hypothetical protein